MKKQSKSDKRRYRSIRATLISNNCALSSSFSLSSSIFLREARSSHFLLSLQLKGRLISENIFDWSLKKLKRKKPHFLPRYFCIVLWFQWGRKFEVLKGLMKISKTKYPGNYRCYKHTWGIPTHKPVNPDVSILIRINRVLYCLVFKLIIIIIISLVKIILNNNKKF